MERKPEQIVEDQIRLWTHQARAYAGAEAAAPPVITISRAAGTPGEQLAEALARRTGYTVWDRELLAAVARESGGDERLMATLDEHRRKGIDDVVTGMLMGSAHTNVQYLRALLRVVRTIAAHGRAIIVGRGANYACDPGTTLRLRIVAPLDERARRLAAHDGTDLKQARRAAEQQDQEQIDFIRFHFKHDGTDSADYDLVLNSATLPLDAMAALALSAAEAKFGRMLVGN